MSVKVYRGSIPRSYLDTDTAMTANSDKKVPSQKAVKTYIGELANALVYKGSINCSGSPNYPAAGIGDVYIVSVAGFIGGVSGIAVEEGDLLLCKVDGTVAGTQVAVGANWDIIQNNLVPSNFAPSAKGVTNGDSHDHAGGDGGQIDHGGLAGLSDDDHTQYTKHSLGTAIGDLLCASSVGAFTALPDVAVNNVLLSGGVGAVPAWGKVGLTTHVSGILPPVNGGDGGTTASASGPVTVTTALNRQTYVATGAVEYDLPTGDLSAFVAAGAVPLKYTFVKTAANTLTVDPGAGNFIANGIAAAKLYDDVSGETYATVTLQLISSAGSVNKWVIVGAHGTWSF